MLKPIFAKIQRFGNELPRGNSSTICINNNQSCGLQKRPMRHQAESCSTVDQVRGVCAGVLEVDEGGPGRQGKVTCTAGAATRFPARSRGVDSGELGGRSCSDRSTACCWREAKEEVGGCDAGWGNGGKARLDGGAAAASGTVAAEEACTPY